MSAPRLPAGVARARTSGIAGLGGSGAAQPSNGEEAAAAGARVRNANPGQPPRKRSRQVHERQVLTDFFSEHDHPDGGAPPTDLIKSMSARDLYEDVYDTYKVDASFDKLPNDTKARMLAEIVAVAPKVSARVVQASDADPSAITVPRDHTHEIILVPDAALVGAGTDPFAALKEVHLSAVCELHAYNVVEDFIRSVSFGGVSRVLSLAKLVRVDLRACVPHSLHHPPDDDPVTYLILELDDRQVFFVAVGVRWRSTEGVDDGPSRLAKLRADPYVQWTAGLFGDLSVAVVEVVSHCYFSCPCI